MGNGVVSILLTIGVRHQQLRGARWQLDEFAFLFVVEAPSEHLALRMVRDPHLAEDVTQGVFTALARNASQLVNRPAISGWLHRTATNLAANAVRADVRLLRDILNRRGVTVGTQGLAVVIVANAVHAAPIGLSAAISTVTSLAGTVVGTSNAVAATHAIAMTTLQKTIVGTTLVIAVGTSVYETRQALLLRG